MPYALRARVWSVRVDSFCMCRPTAPGRTCMCTRARVGRAMSRGRCPELRDLCRARVGHIISCSSARNHRMIVLLSFRPANSAVVKATRDVHTRTDTFWRFSGVYRLSGVWKRVYKPCSREGDFRIFICVCAHVPGGLGDGGGSHSICVSRVEPCVHTQPEPAHSWIVILVSRAARARAARVPGGGVLCVAESFFFAVPRRPETTYKL